MADAIAALRDILNTNWSKPPEPTIEDIADLDRGDAKRVRMLDTDVIRIFETAHNEAQPELLYDYVNEHVNITIDCRTVDSRERLSEIRDEVRRIIYAFRKGDGSNFDRIIYKTRTDLSDRSKKLFRYTIQCEVVTFSSFATSADPVINPATGDVSGGNTFQTYDGDLTTLAQMTPSDGVFIVGSGSNWVAESGATARTSLGLGSMATQNSDAVNITGGSLSGISGLVSSITAGTGITGSATEGAVTLNVGGLTISELAADSLQTSSESFADNDTSLMTSAAIQDKILSYGFTTEVGDITAVTAGTGLSGGGSSGDVTVSLDLKDEDNMASNSATHAASQQSIKAYVDSEVSGLVDSAPGALDTLNELAAAINDDASFSSTMTTALGNRVRADASQTFSASEQLQARTNIGLIAASVPTAGTGIDISGSEFSVDVSDFMGSGANNRVLTATGTDAFQGEATLTYDGTTLTIDNGGDEVIALGSGSGLATMEMGGDSGARIDLKSPNSDDYDIRIHTTGNGGEIVTASPLTFKTSNNNDDITFVPHGSGKVKFGTGGTEFTLPTARGTSGQVLKIGSGGVVEFGTDENDDTTYAISSTTVSGGANLVLTAGGSGSGTDTVKFTGGTNTTITQSSDEITIASNDTTYTTSVVDSSDDALIRLTAGGSGSGNDDIKLVAGANVTLTPDTGTSPPQITITASTQGDITGVVAGTGLSGGGSDGDVTLNVDVSEFSAVTPASGDSFLTLDSDGSTEQRTTVDALATLLAGTNISASNGVLSSTDTNTFRTVTAGGNTLGASETLAFTEGSNVTITESGGAVTIASTDTNTQLSTEQVQDIVGAMVSSNTETNISVTYDDTNGKLDFVSTDTNTQLTLLDEDNFSSNSATAAASQQSIKAYVDSKTASIVDSAPAALDTLNELAAALNDDASFSTTTATSLGNRLRIDDNQSLTSTQQAQGLTNLGITASLAEINILDGGLSASDIPSLAASKITSGTLGTARIPSLATSKITSGTFANGRISEGSVTQHQAALSITESQISDFGSYITAPRTVTAGGNTLANGETLAFTAGSNVTITESAGAVTIAATDTNTTYGVGNGIGLSSTTFFVNAGNGLAQTSNGLQIADPATLDQLTESTDATDDKILLWDESASSWKYMTIDDLQDSIDTASGGGAVSAVANGANNRIATFSSADALNGEANLIWDGTNLGVGKSSPLFPLHLQYTDNRTDPEGSGLSSGAGAIGANAQGGGLYIENKSTTDGSFAGITFRTDTADARIAYQSVGSSLINEGQMSFYLDTNDSPNQLTLEEVLRLRGGGSGGGQTFNSAFVNGRLGVGTASPGDTLHLTGGQGYMKFGTSGSKGHVKSDYNLELYADDGGNNSATYQNIKFFTAGSNERMRIDSAGNVGIGHTSPNRQLHIMNSASATDNAFIRISAGNEGISGIEFGDTDDGDIGKLLYDHDGSIGMRFVSGASERMRIKTDGNVGIGTTSPQSKLHISSGTSGDAVLILEADTDNNSETDQPFIVFEQDGGTQHSAIGSHSGSQTDNNALILSNSVSSSGIEAGMIFKTGTTSGYANAVERMRITPAGDITMTEDLDVAKHFSFDTQHVGGSAGGSTGTENGANTWCKILEWDPGTGQFKDLSLTLGITTVDIGSQNQAIINVYGRSNATNGAHTIGVKVISLISTHHLQDDSFKMITEGWGQPIELWMKKYGTYGTYNWNEIAKKKSSSTTLTYSSNSAWQSTEPVKTNGSPQATRSYGTVIETRNPVLNLYHNQNVSGLSAGDVLSTISFRKHTSTGGNESIRIYNVQGDSGSSGASDDFHTSDLRISTRKIGTNADQFTDRFTILGQEGYVGIGTMSPAVPLHVGSGNNEAARFLGSGNDAFIKVQEPTGSENVVLGSTGGTGFVGSASNNNFAIRANNSNKMFVTPAGKVGIGTASPTGKLTVTDSGHDMIHLNRTVDNEGYGAGIIGRLGNDASTTAAHEYGGIFFQIEDHTAGAEKGSIAFNTSTGGVAADQGSTHAMQITSDNKVGIGTSSPTHSLHVVGNAMIQKNESDSENLMLRLRDSSVNTIGERIGIEGYWNSVPAGHIEFELTNVGTGAAAMVFSPHSGSSTTNEALRIAADGVVTTASDLTVGGNLTVSGSTTTLNTATLTVEDNTIVLNSNVTGTPADVDAGIIVERGDETNPTFLWDEGGDYWEADGPGTGNSFVAKNANGYIALGPQNGSYAHITTGNSRFYFNRDLVIGENAIASYNGDFAIRRNQDSQDQITVKEHAMTFTSDNNVVMAIDGTNKRIGINEGSPQKDLHIKNLNEATILLQKSEAGEHYPRATVQTTVNVYTADIAGALSANATSMTIDGSGASSFASSGRAEIRATQDTFTYTGKTDNGDGTFTLTGIPSSGDNAIAAVDDNAVVINHPETFTIDGGSGQSAMPTSGTYYIHRTGDSFTADYSFNSGTGIGTFTNVVGLRESLFDGDIVDSDSPTTAVIGFMGNDQSGSGGRIGSSISHVARSAFGDYRLDFGVGSYLQKDPYYQANEFNYSVETEPRMTILDNGVVGIGTTSPVVYSSNATSLNIHDDTIAELRLTTDQTGTASGSGSLIQAARAGGTDNLYIWNAEAGHQIFATSATERMRLTSAGNLGIGTTSPSHALHVKGSGVQKIKVESTDNEAAIELASDSSGPWVMYSANSSDDLRWYGNSAVRMSLTSAGNLGIGTTSPAAKLDSRTGSGFALIAGADVNATTLTDNTRKFVRFGAPHYDTDEEPVTILTADSDSAYSRISIGGGTNAGNAPSQIFFHTGADTTTQSSNTATAAITSTGLGIGTTSPSNSLHIQSATAGVLIESTATSGEAPVLDLYKNDSGPAVSEAIGTIKFSGENDADQKVTYAEIQAYIQDETDATENAAFQFWVQEMGTPRENLRLASNQITFNNSERNVDVLIKSDDGSTNFFSDAGNNRIGIGTNSPAYLLDVAGTGRFTGTVRIENTLPELKLIDTDATNDPTARIINNNGNLSIRADSENVGTGGAINFTTSGTERMRLSDAGNLGINTTAPSYPLHIDHNATNPATDGDFAIFIDHDSSGSGATGGDREQGGLYVDADSSATGGDQSNEHRLYGIWSDTRLNGDGDADAVYAVYGYAETQRGGSPTTATTNVAGGYFVAASDDSTANSTVSAMYGSLGYVSLQDTGVVSNAHGARGQTIVSGNRATNLANIRGTSSEVDIGGSRTGGDITITSAKVYEGFFDHNVTDANGDSAVVTDAYMWYGNYSVSQADQVGTKWGIYNTGEDKNYFSAPVGINDTTPSGDLDIIGEGGGNGDINLSRTSGATINVQAQASAGIIGTTTNHNFQIKTNGSVRTTVTTGGLVGIGDTTPNAMLKVESTDGSVPTIYAYRNDSSTSQPLVQLIEDSVYADNPTLYIRTDRTDGAIPSISVEGGAVTASGPNGWGTWEHRHFYARNYGTQTGQGSGLHHITDGDEGNINAFSLPYDAKLRAVQITYNTATDQSSSTADQKWRLFHSGDPANVVTDITVDISNDFSNPNGNQYIHLATGLDVNMPKGKGYSMRRETGNLDLFIVKIDIYFTRHTTNF